MRRTVLSLVLVAVLAAPLAAAPPRTLDVDVLVVGATPAGIAAAAAAARAGARVHVVEASPKMGGVITWAWLTTFDMNLSGDGMHLTRGIFLEYYRGLGLSFDLDQAIDTLTWEVYREPLVGSTAKAPFVEVVKDGARLAAVRFEDRDWGRTLTVRAKQVIDATDDADLAAAAGVPFTVGRPGPNGETWMQAATLIFRVGGVDWRALADDLQRRKGAGADAAHWGVNGKAAWGYGEVMRQYRPTQPDASVLGLNIALQNDRTVLLNVLQIHGVDGLDAASVDRGMAKAKQELPALVRFLRERIPGFGDAELVNSAPRLYIRETRHVKGMYTLTAEDIGAERVFRDRIAVASYPIDIHPYTPTWTSPFPPARKVYTIPYRSLVPLEVDNLQVASRSLSATSEAAGSARMVPTTMAMGQAAGVTAAFCAKQKCTPRDVAGRADLLAGARKILLQQGVYLGGGF